MNQNAKTPMSDILREYGLTDDQILEFAICRDGLMDSAKSLRYLIEDKTGIDTLQAVEIIKKLQKEL